MTFTPTPPTKPGAYWIAPEEHPIDIVWVMDRGDGVLIGYTARGESGTIAELSRYSKWSSRLVPVEELEKAYKEGWTEGFACDGQASYGFEAQRDNDYEKSRARRVMEGLE